MKTYDIKGVTDWFQVAAKSDPFQFLARGQHRTVEMTFNTSEPVTVMIADNVDMHEAVIMASETGLFSVRATVTDEAYIAVVMHKDAIVFAKSAVPDMRRKISEVNTFTNIEPRTRATEFDRMMYQMRQNEARRDAEMQKAVAKIEQQAEKQAAKDARIAERKAAKAEASKVIDDDETPKGGDE